MKIGNICFLLCLRRVAEVTLTLRAMANVGMGDFLRIPISKLFILINFRFFREIFSDEKNSISSCEVKVNSVRKRIFQIVFQIKC